MQFEKGTNVKMDFVIGFIVGFGFYTGVRTIRLSNKSNKVKGIIQLILTFLAPLLIHLWCLKKDDFVFGGSNWKFLVQTAVVDKMIEPWLILMLYIDLIVLIIYNLVQIGKIKHK